jgi:hypothetical protein
MVKTAVLYLASAKILQKTPTRIFFEMTISSVDKRKYIKYFGTTEKNRWDSLTTTHYHLAHFCLVASIDIEPLWLSSYVVWHVLPKHCVRASAPPDIE